MFSKGNAILFVSLLFFLLAAQAAQAAHYKDYKTIKAALEHGEPSLNFRLRHEQSKQEYLLDGRASTLQSKFGYKSADFYQNNLSLEIVNVSSFLGQHYNPAVGLLTKPDYTVISDPRGIGISNMNITSQWFPYTDLILGRQYISLDNERMVGDNPFRQYPTSFDAITVKNDYFQYFEIFYSFIGHINTYKNDNYNVEGRRKLYTNLVNVTWKNFMYGQITAYVYSNNDHDVSDNSQNTMGLRAISDKEFKQEFDYGYELEVAHQKNKVNNPNKYSAIYIAANVNKEIAEIFNNWTIISTLGGEFLGGHSGGAPGRSFRFPLGSLYGFNGLAEGYTTTPDRGLIDYYTSCETQYLDSLSLVLSLHLFQFAKGSGQQIAGREIDFSVAYKFTKDVNIQFRVAHLNAINNSTRSVKRVSGQLSYLAL